MCRHLQPDAEPVGTPSSNTEHGPDTHRDGAAMDAASSTSRRDPVPHHGVEPDHTTTARAREPDPFLVSREEQNQETHAENGNGAVAEPDPCFLSREERNQEAHAENGNTAVAENAREREELLHAFDAGVVTLERPLVNIDAPACAAAPHLGSDAPPSPSQRSRRCQMYVLLRGCSP